MEIGGKVEGQFVQGLVLPLIWLTAGWPSSLVHQNSMEVTI